MSLLRQPRRILVYVDDLAEAVRYYRDVLGFTPGASVEGANQEFETAGPPLVLHHSISSPLHPGGLTGIVPSFQVEDIQAVVAQLKASGVKTVMDLTEVPHGWIYFFLDPYGNTIQVYQPKGV